MVSASLAEPMPIVSATVSSVPIEMVLPAVPPIVTEPVEEPVLMEVLKLELLFKETAAPEMVRPKAPWSRPAPELTPTATMAPALLMFQVLEVPEMSLPVPAFEMARTSPEAEASERSVHGT